MNVIPLAAATLWLGAAATYRSRTTKENPARRRRMGVAGWSVIALGSLGMIVELGPIGGSLLGLSVLGLGWIAGAMLTPVSARGARLLNAGTVTALLAWGVVG